MTASSLNKQRNYGKLYKYTRCQFMEGLKKLFTSVESSFTRENVRHNANDVGLHCSSVEQNSTEP